MWEEMNSLHYWWECKFVKPLWKILWRLLRDLKIELPYDGEKPLIGMYLKEYKSGYNKSTFTPMFIAALFTVETIRNSQDILLMMNGLRKHVIYKQWNFIQS
jgi:hypothetical protein